MWTNILILVLVTSVAVATIMQSQQWIHMGEGNVPTTSPISNSYARGVGDCARACSQTDTSVSFFFVEDTKECQCHDVKTHPSLVYEPSAKSFERGAAVPTVFSCPVDNLSFRRMVLSDGSQFAYRALMDVTRSFAEAVTKCSEINGTILEVLTLEKFNFVVELMACSGFTTSHFWMNGVYNENTTRWETTGGVPLPMSDDFWASGKPNGSGVEQCVFMSQGAGHKWDDRSCSADSQLLGLCEMP